ncbi:hypothetical protein BGX20_007728 [Mortierella sp. AD010]|nr:hypothetical protein BGX20_007728 [Mortierella sp. AD010]
MSDRRTSFMMDNSLTATEVSLAMHPSVDGPASWTTSQGEDAEGVMGMHGDDGDMQDSDDPDTTDNFDQELDESQDQEDEDDLEAKMDELYHQLQTETKAKESAESLLEARVYRSRDVGNSGNNKLRNQVEQELQATIDRIADINMQLDYYKHRAFDLPSFGYIPEVLKESQSSAPTVLRRSHSNSFSTSEFADNEDDRQSIHSALSDIVSSLRGLLDSPSVRLENLLNLVNILKQNQHIHPGYPLQELVSCLRVCLASTVREIRLNAYRCLRLLSVTGPLGPVLTAYKIDLFIIRYQILSHYPISKIQSGCRRYANKPGSLFVHHDRSLMSDQNIESERIEALKLVRCFVTTKEGMQYVSDGVIRAIIAVAEQNDEKLRNACLETLGEMIMSDPKPVARCGGFRAVLVSLTDNLQDLSDALLKVFLYMLESPETRIYVRQGLDSEMVMSVFTDIYSQGPSYTDRVKATGRIVTSMFRSWAGLFDLCANDKRAIRSLVQSIKLPIQENRQVLLEMLYEIFRIQTPKWLKGFLDGKTENGGHTKVNDIEARKVLRKATLLIPELMQLACKVLPADKSTHLQTLPSLFQVATNVEDTALRHIATHAFQFIDTLIQASRGIIPEPLDGKKQADRIKQKIGTQLDESNFRALLNDTQVLNTKDASKWKWSLILEIIQGPMLNSKRLDEAIRTTKFSKRLLAFYRPLNHHYSSQAANDSPLYTKIGCALFEILANNPEGSKYLAQNKILKLIADGLAQLDPVQGHKGSDPIFSREKMEATMTSGYFEMLGTLCKTRSGSRLLERFKIFNLYYRLSELRSRDDIVKRIITSMDYSIDGHPRVILSKIMTSGYKHIRLYATQHLGTVIKNDRNEFNDWAIRLLCTQLCDPSMDVCHMAVRALDDACSQKKNLDFLIQLRPNLDHLGEAGNPLLLRFLSTSRGFHYLDDMSYIEGEMDDWFMFANRQYMIQTEVKLAKAMELQRFNPFAEDGKFENEAERLLARAKHVLTPHFYGELTRTEEGCDLLRRKGHFGEYARYIREHCAESKDPATISDLKAILWAVGHIGSTVGGLPFLEDEDLIKYIVGMAERSKVLSLKGTCFYVLGLMCKTTQGIEILEDYGWQGILHRDRTPRGLCLPKDLDRFLDVPRWDQYRENVPPVVIPLATEGDIVEKEILKATGELGNHILTNGASKNLAKIKGEHSAYFTSLTLYSAVLDVLGSYHFRLPVRRFVLGLFDVKLESLIADRPDSLGSTASILPLSSITATEAAAGSRDISNIIGRSSFDSPSRPTAASRDTHIVGRASFDSPSRPNMASREFGNMIGRSSFDSPSRPLMARDMGNIMGRSSFDSPSRPTRSNGISPRAPRSQSSTEIIPGPPLPLPSTSMPSTSHLPASVAESELGPALQAVVEKIDTTKANSEFKESIGQPSMQSPAEISPTLTLSLPPIPPPRPPPHAYEILYTNKPYHKNFAKEAGLAPLPPRVKVLHLGPEDDEDLTRNSSQKPPTYGTNGSSSNP